ncbi:murein hydrolase activator EnvC family protein [Chondromyces apiculatus]|uniref:Peptidase M23B n=1 Tax=Chondromyces apiculatus DSM 436 TaxID=1192034 RepID=A0A017TCM4_9BACT|nr:peptidoglycan DD-metalloendopeptidase family protein [Chondromyces apiculatus]EYF06667.1 peptidase M23B [Chondromyces apiculatus DSM 436]
MSKAPRAALLLLAALTVSGASGARAPAGAVPASLLGDNDLDRLLAKLTADEKALTTELGAIGPDIATTRARMVARGRAYYRGLRAGFLPAGGGFDALVDHAARVERLRLSLERDIAHEGDLTRRGAEITDQLVRVRAERAPLEVKREAMNRARVALAQEEDRRAAFARAFETSVRPEHVAIYGAAGGVGGAGGPGGPSDTDGRAGFRGLKGRLPFPIAGRAEVRPLTRRGSHVPGLSLAASASAPVRSVAAGRVAFADTYADYGLTVIVDHGDRYYSLYAGLGAVDVRVSDQVVSGARVGAVGEGGAEGQIYFELRHGAEAIPAGEWFGL